MFSNLSTTLQHAKIDYPIPDHSVPFSEYISRCRSIIEKNRIDLQQNSNVDKNIIIAANSPFELYPHHAKSLKYGALFIHGLFDSPFTLKDVALRLHANGMLTRAILLPGHGITPGSLINASYQDWIQIVRYGVETLRHEVDHIYLVGYSTGAVLALYHSLQDPQISGIVMLSPAIQVKRSIEIITQAHWLTGLIVGNKQWLDIADEVDYAKYRSLALNGPTQVSLLIKTTKKLLKQHAIPCPLLLVVTKEDETISSRAAIQFFSRLTEKQHRLLLYSAANKHYHDPRILVRNGRYPEYHIKNLSHISLPFSPDNHHYGKDGDYVYATRLNTEEIIYGACDRFEEKYYDLLYKFGLAKQKHRQLTFNPDFDFMMEQIMQFLSTTTSNAKIA